MYDENAATGAPVMPELEPRSSGSWTHNIFSKAETIIPIILIVLFLLFFAISFMGVNANDIPLIGGFLSSILGNDKPDILIIGYPDPITEDLFNREDFKNLYRFSTPRDPSTLDRNPISTIKKYDVVIIDQSQSSSKSIPIALADALKSYVNSGGKLIIVADSAYRLTGRPDAYGWISVFGSTLAPVDCQMNRDRTRACEYPILIRGVLEKVDFENKALEMVPEQIPATANDGSSLPFTVYDVDRLGDELMYIQDVAPGGKTYAGVVVKSAWAGKVGYFNYNEIGMTPQVVDAILRHFT